MYIRKIIAAALCAAVFSGCAPFAPAEATPAPKAETREFYNAAQELSLRIDGESFVLSRAGELVRGSCETQGNSLVLSWEGGEAAGTFDGDRLNFPAIRGDFLPAEEAGSPGALGLLMHPQREYGPTESGVLRMRDYELELALDCPEDFALPEGIIADALVVRDSGLGCVTGRNVSGEFDGGDAESFLENYMAEQLLSDARALYGGEAAEWRESGLLEENISGRLASAEGVLETGAGAIYVKSIMYTSTYADGTVNYICKSFFAPEGDTAAFNALANGVVNMSAVRRVES